MECKRFVKNHSPFFRNWLLTFAMLLFSYSHLHSGNPQINAYDALNALYEFRFLDADSIITKLETDYPDHFLPVLARSQYQWWQIISQKDSPILRQNYLRSLEHAEKKIIEHFNGSNPQNEHIFHLINIYASRARLDLLNRDYLSTLGHLRKSVDYINMSLSRENLYKPFLLTSGLYNYTLGYGQAKYPFLKIYSLWFHKGDALLGINLLEKAARGNDELTKTEANYFLMKIYLELEKKLFLALPYAKWLVDTYPDNIIYVYHYYKIATGLNLHVTSQNIKNDFENLLQNNQQLSKDQVKHLRDLFAS
jgi:hypothetical protein